ncbi:uncharacterized protein LOC144454002 [Glandiceps talaboti]
MYAWSLKNPDDDFVLHGTYAPIRVKDSDYLTNSQRTLTTRSLSQTTYRPERYSSLEGSISKHSTAREQIPDYTDLTSSGNFRPQKSVSFDASKYENGTRDSFPDDLEPELERLMEGGDRERKQEDEDILIGMPPNPRKRTWFTQPVHLSKSTEYPALESAGLDVRDCRKSDRDTGTLGTNMAARKIISENFLDEEAKKTYPITLGDASHDLYRTFSPPPSLKPTRSQSPPTSSRSRQRPRSAMSATDPKVRASADYYCLKAAEPSLMRSDVIASPYEYELAKLRMQKLRLEEEKLLELKRQVELERIRGPTPKWYEIKGPQFHYEAKKNNLLLKKKEEWQNLFDYRKELLASSREFAKLDSLQ